MASNDLYNGQEVWVTGGSNTGKKGTVVGTGFGNVRVQLDAETKVFSRGDITATNPQTVPLPPNFLPLDHSVGATVKIEGHPNKTFNGITGTVTKLPTSTSYANNGDKRYHIKVTSVGKTSYDVGEILCFEPPFVKAAPIQRVEGKEIGHADVRINDVIRVEYRSGAEGFRQMSSKEGRVTVIHNVHGREHDALSYTFRTSHAGSSHMLNYNSKDEKIILVKAAPNPYVEILEKLTAGTVIVRENSNGTTSTFVKAPDWHSESQWHVMNSLSSKSSSFVTDSDILRVLVDGAEFVHKVRK